jgi:hypothetical protein
MENHFNDAASLLDLSPEELIGESVEGGISDDSSFDPQVLEDAIKPLLVATILLINLCTGT